MLSNAPQCTVRWCEGSVADLSASAHPNSPSPTPLLAFGVFRVLGSESIGFPDLRFLVVVLRVVIRVFRAPLDMSDLGYPLVMWYPASNNVITLD